MSTSKRLDFNEIRKRVETSHQMVTGEGLGGVQTNLLIKYNAWLIHELLSNTLEQFGLSAPGYISMTMINSAPGQMANPSDMSLCTGETRANMTRICDDLVAKGWLQRVTNPNDRRRVDMSLTPEGLALLKQVIPIARAKNREVFEVFNDDERATLERLLLKLLGSLESHL